ncbi:hypothetical protein QR680_012891 [Steinernema hermaphroditum]|uniref:Uncharacterized protein n=1 Tax=Steinernema hermaphroditum TaxID=289476 RepID=A0AA39M0N3_9BILA|nr:hypothetical protein QR680_012891 [Steinernema hermaphroditum]
MAFTGPELLCKRALEVSTEGTTAKKDIQVLTGTGHGKNLLCDHLCAHASSDALKQLSPRSNEWIVPVTNWDEVSKRKREVKAKPRKPAGKNEPIDTSVHWNLRREMMFNTTIPRIVIYKFICDEADHDCILDALWRLLKSRQDDKRLTLHEKDSVSQLVKSAAYCIFCTTWMIDMCALIGHLQSEHLQFSFVYKGLHQSLLWPVIEVSERENSAIASRLFVKSIIIDYLSFLSSHAGHKSATAPRTGTSAQLVTFLPPSGREEWKKSEDGAFAVDGVTLQCHLKSAELMSKDDAILGTGWFLKFMIRRFMRLAPSSAMIMPFFLSWTIFCENQRKIYGRRDFPTLKILRAFVDCFRAEMGEEGFFVGWCSHLAYYFTHRIVSQDSAYSSVQYLANSAYNAADDVLAGRPEVKPRKSKPKRKRARRY